MISWQSAGGGMCKLRIAELARSGPSAFPPSAVMTHERPVGRAAHLQAGGSSPLAAQWRGGGSELRARQAHCQPLLQPVASTVCGRAAAAAGARRRRPATALRFQLLVGIASLQCFNLLQISCIYLFNPNSLFIQPI